MKNSLTLSPDRSQPSDDDIPDDAFRLCEQSQCVGGDDFDN